MVDKVLKIDDIKASVKQIAKEFDLVKVTLFGSYANGTATKDSDIDLLVEFTTDSVSLFKLAGLKNKMEELTGKEVDVIHAPIPKESIIEIEAEVLLYAA